MNSLKAKAVFSMVFLLAFAVQASGIVLQKQDFSSAQITKQKGEILVKAHLTKPGFAKLKDVDLIEGGQQVEVQLGGESFNLKLRDKLTQKKLQMGPFTQSVAEKIRDDINRH
jgi:hypothetical protein